MTEKKKKNSKLKEGEKRRSSLSQKLKKAFCCLKESKKIRKYKMLTKSTEKNEKRAKVRKLPVLKQKESAEEEKRRKLLKKKLLKARAEPTPKQKILQLPRLPLNSEPWLITHPLKSVKQPLPPTPPVVLKLESSSASETNVSIPETSQKIKKKRKLSPAKTTVILEEKKPKIDFNPPEQSLHVQFFQAFDLPAMRWDYTDSRPNSLLIERPKLENILRHIVGEHPDTIMAFEEVKNVSCRCWKCRLQQSMSTFSVRQK